MPECPIASVTAFGHGYCLQPVLYNTKQMKHFFSLAIPLLPDFLLNHIEVKQLERSSTENSTFLFTEKKKKILILSDSNL